MRIVEFCTVFPKGGGIQTHVQDLAAWLRSHDHEVVFAGEPGENANETNSSDFISLPMRKVSRTDGNVVFRVAALLYSAFLLRRRLARQQVDIIHAHETAPALVARLAVLGKKIPIVMTFHGSALERIPSAARIARFCADLTASPSRISLNALIENGVNPEKARVLGLGIKPMPEVPKDEVKALRKSYVSDPEGKLVFSPSRLDPQKGIDVMIEVARRVVEKHPETVFVVAGSGPLEGDVVQWAKDAGIARNMRFVGTIDTVPAHLKASDIFLLTSRWEALPISIVEAFCAGLPVIATDCGGVSELVDDKVGMLCPVEDVTAATNALLELLENPGLRKEKGEAGLARSREGRFDCDAVHATFQKTYEELISR